MAMRAAWFPERMASLLKWVLGASMLAATAVLLAAGAWAATEGSSADLHAAPPPAPYARVSQLVPLPDFLPGLGTLYVDPATLPVGPFLAYDRSGQLVGLIFMVPIEDLNAHRTWTELAARAAGWFTVDHVDIDYNPGHPGVERPHYHINLWAVSHQEEQRRLAR